MESTPSVTAALANIEVEGDDPGVPGAGPVAIGALPYDPESAGHLVVPARLFGRSGSTYWTTDITGGVEEDPGRPQTSGAPPDEFTLTPSMPHAEWREVIRDAVEAIDQGDLRKVVLARRVDIAANHPFVIPDVLERLVALYPSCMVFSVGGFIGASPELLISRHGGRVDSHPLAGTVARSGDEHGDQLLIDGLMGSEKARREHQVVVDSITEALGPVCPTLDVPATPSVMGLRNVSHLATHITGRLPADGSAPSALDLVARVHPVGWVDASGDGAWAIGIRCAEIDGAHARLYAGNGIVAGSDPASELAETQLKLQALLAAVVRP
jgi:menaquinone-specific isochorismate synthase